jgi:hypothetical protein
LQGNVAFRQVGFFAKCFIMFVKSLGLLKVVDIVAVAESERLSNNIYLYGMTKLI